MQRQEEALERAQEARTAGDQERELASLRKAAAAGAQGQELASRIDELAASLASIKLNHAMSEILGPLGQDDLSQASLRYAAAEPDVRQAIQLKNAHPLFTWTEEALTATGAKYQAMAASAALALYQVEIGLGSGISANQLMATLHPHRRVVTSFTRAKKLLAEIDQRIARAQREQALHLLQKASDAFVSGALEECNKWLSEIDQSALTAADHLRLSELIRKNDILYSEEQADKIYQNSMNSSECLRALTLARAQLAHSAQSSDKTQLWSERAQTAAALLDQAWRRNVVTSRAAPSYLCRSRISNGFSDNSCEWNPKRQEVVCVESVAGHLFVCLVRLDGSATTVHMNPPLDFSDPNAMWADHDQIWILGGEGILLVLDRDSLAPVRLVEFSGHLPQNSTFERGIGFPRRKSVWLQSYLIGGEYGDSTAVVDTERHTLRRRLTAIGALKSVYLDGERCLVAMDYNEPKVAFLMAAVAGSESSLCRLITDLWIPCPIIGKPLMLRRILSRVCSSF